jgi:hypothetical protein
MKQILRTAWDGRGTSDELSVRRDHGMRRKTFHSPDGALPQPGPAPSPEKSNSHGAHRPSACLNRRSLEDPSAPRCTARKAGGGVRCAGYRGVRQAFSTGSASYRLPGPRSRQTSLATRFVAKHRKLRMPEAGVADESIYGEWSRAAENEGCEAGDIQQIDLITRRSELRARRRHAYQLY